MIEREMAKSLQERATRYPIVAVTGPRQSGKTTLVQSVFSSHEYVSLEVADVRELAESDPRKFLARYSGEVVFDEIQRAPTLFSYLQVMVDEDARPGRFILTGSQNFLLLDSISQSLAGRVSILHLLPFSLTELQRASRRQDLDRTLFSGLYPRVYDRSLPPSEWYGDYVQTYIERDVRSIINVGDLSTFRRFLQLCAGRTGQILNLSSLGADCGVSHNTVRAWISILEASFVVHLLRPYHTAFNKRIIKSPKLYFFDTGVVCSLLGVTSKDQLFRHPLYGSIFETLVISELHKTYLNRGERPPLYFWRDRSGTEIDCLIDRGDRQLAIEIKSGQTVNSSFFDGLDRFGELANISRQDRFLVYGGDDPQDRTRGRVTPWSDVSSIPSRR